MKRNVRVPLSSFLLLACATVLILLPSCLGRFDRRVVIRWWAFPWFQGLTGRETEGLALDDVRRAQYTYLDWNKKIAKQFMATHPEADVRLELLDWGRGRSKVELAVYAGFAKPDVITDSISNVYKFALHDLLEPLDELLTEEDIVDLPAVTLEYSRYKGQLVFWPIALTTQTLIANFAVFEERDAVHLLPNNPDRLWTYEEFLRAAQATTFDRDGDGIVDVYGFAVHFVGGQGDYGRHAFLWGKGARIFSHDGQRVILNCPGAVEGMRFLYELVHKYNVMPDGVAGLRLPDSMDLWLQGRLAMFPQSLTIFREIRIAEKDGRIQPGTVKAYPVCFPADLPDVSPSVYVDAEGVGVTRQHDHKKRKLVFELVKLITNTEHTRLFAIGTLDIPARRSSAYEYDHPGVAFIAETGLKYGTTDYYSPYVYQIRQFLTPMYQSVLTGKQTPEHAVREAEMKSNQFIQYLRGKFDLGKSSG